MFLTKLLDWIGALCHPWISIGRFLTKEDCCPRLNSTLAKLQRALWHHVTDDAQGVIYHRRFILKKYLSNSWNCLLNFIQVTSSKFQWYLVFISHRSENQSNQMGKIYSVCKKLFSFFWFLLVDIYGFFGGKKVCPFFISEDLCMEAKTLIHQTYPRITFPITYWKFFYSISKVKIQGEGKTHPIKLAKT